MSGGGGTMGSDEYDVPTQLCHRRVSGSDSSSRGDLMLLWVNDEPTNVLGIANVVKQETLASIYLCSTTENAVKFLQENPQLWQAAENKFRVITDMTR